MTHTPGEQPKSKQCGRDEEGQYRPPRAVANRPRPSQRGEPENIRGQPVLRVLQQGQREQRNQAKVGSGKSHAKAAQTPASAAVLDEKDDRHRQHRRYAGVDAKFHVTITDQIVGGQ